MKGIVLFIFCTWCLLLHAQRSNSSLDGAWSFALDPVKVGEHQQWFKSDFPYAKFDKVKVPHCFSVDPRYLYYTGTAWYFRKFTSAPAGDDHLFLRFEAVFYKTKIWLNGKQVGEHEGGYTPFEIDITKELQLENVLAIQVDNAWDTTTIPGAKTIAGFSSANDQQLYPWINYGGITRSVHLSRRPAVHLSNYKVVPDLDLKKGDARIDITAFVTNASPKTNNVTVQAMVFNNGVKVPVVFKPSAVQITAGAKSTAQLTATIPAKDVKRWSVDEPNLYTAKIIVASDTVSVRFGIRKFEVSGTKLLLNGEPIKMGGCNRPLDYPGFGSMDPKQVLDQDLSLIKSGGMELSRINHYPVPEYMLDWADEHGLLIITEAGNWQMTPKQMNDTMMRRKFKSQMQEMVERDWNHPSVIAYSMGNEFQSQTEEGKAWVRDMAAFTKTLDNSRLITFASMIVWRDMVQKPGDEASQYVDFISANIYGNHLKYIQHIHEIYPDKPIYISEFGIRTDAVKTESERVDHLRKAMQDFRQCDYVVGASIWTFNDYFSRYPGTAANGYRPWGLVSPERETRAMYTAWQEEFSPAIITLENKKDGRAIINISARKDFPAYRMKGFQLKYGQQLIALNNISPGETQRIEIFLPGDDIDIELIKPGGFTILKKNLK